MEHSFLKHPLTHNYQMKFKYHLECETEKVYFDIYHELHFLAVKISILLNIFTILFSF